MRALRKFLAHHRLTEAEFADWLGCDRSIVNRWINDGAIPSPDKMRAIYKLTRGQVRPDHFYDLPRLSRPAAPFDDDNEDISAVALK
jgi:transcriptional regulator with XRE-family HTH domain